MFAFDGGTNFDPAKDAHMHEGSINIGGKDNLTAEWQGWAGGKFVHAEKFELSRK